ncbi:MAG: hypothetical protein ACP5QO_08250 [Clostridia bacterium]
MGVTGRGRSLRGHTLALLFLLVMEFLIGMWVNLFVKIPPHHPGVSPSYFAGVAGGVPWALLHGPLVLQLHVALGLILGLMGIAHLVRLIRDLGAGRLWWSVVGLLGLSSAAGNGASFLNYGHNFSSMLMSVGFALALVGYGMSIGNGRRAATLNG